MHGWARLMLTRTQIEKLAPNQVWVRESTRNSNQVRTESNCNSLKSAAESPLGSCHDFDFSSWIDTLGFWLLY